MIKVCYVGCTGHHECATDHIKRNPETFEVCGVCHGPDGEDVTWLSDAIQKAGFAHVIYDDYEKMFDECKPDIAVVIPYFGNAAKISAAAMRRGIHVVSDKPLATTMADLDMLRGVYEASGCKIAAMLGSRYDASFSAVRSLVQSGAVGKVRLVNAQKCYRLGKRGPGYTSRALYGGTIPWVAIHAVDWVRWITGLDYKTVSARHSTVENFGHNDLELTTLSLFTMENDVITSVSADYLRPLAAPRHDDDRLRIMGTGGSLELRDRTIYLINNEESTVCEQKGVSGDLFGDFILETTGKGKCRVSADDSFYITEVCIRARDAADSGATLFI